MKDFEVGNIVKNIEGVIEGLNLHGLLDEEHDPLGGSVEMASEDGTIQEQFTVGPNSELSVSNISGQVQVRGGREGIISFRAQKGGSSRAAQNTHIEFSQDGNRVRIETRGEKGLLNLSRHVSSVDYVIEVPHDCRVQVQAVSADVSIEDIAAPVQARTVSGDVAIREVVGECSLTTVSGDATGKRVSGTLTVRTTSGDAQLMESSLSHFNLNTVSGDLTIETPLVSGQHYLAKTVSGDLELSVPDGTGATVQMKTISGDVSTELPADIIKAGRRNWQGRINGGGANVEMNSVSGDLTITRSTSAFTGAPASQTSQPQSPDNSPAEGPTPVVIRPDVPPLRTPEEQSGADTNAVLQALEKGDISVEEAMSRLDSLQ